ncbi:MAG TPA: LytTR family DNA-binding domain-containing protein [Bryobacteraceae bacterium]|nr:LytTR family DNA-binding domain-containing protein [Bryobacteraceae bacterium]
MPIRVLLVDDEGPARRKLRRLLADAPDFEIAGEAADGDAAIESIERLKPDAVFLDMQMPKHDGLEVAAALTAPLPEIVFVTAHDKFALKAFEVHALDYLLKPYDAERFSKVLERIRERRRVRPGDDLVQRLQTLLSERTARRVLVREKDRAYFVALNEVDWIEGERNYALLHMQGKTYTVRATLESLLKQLDPNTFIRVNRSAIVRTGAVQELQPWTHGEYKVRMKDGSELMWTRRFLAHPPIEIFE